MDSGVGATSVVLLQHELFVVFAMGRVVWCRLLMPPHLAPATGAAAGKSLVAYLADNVLVRRSSWLGVIIDVRRGPSVVGPVTLQGIERTFALAEEVRKPLAALVGSAATQREQYGNVQRKAPRFTLVTDDPAVAVDWMTRAG
jgi:hypothetical protein